VILSYGPYAKGLPFQVGYTSSWEQMVRNHPDVAAGSTNKYQAWEVADPEKWVPHGYACVRVDARGWGRSPGYLEPYSPRETRDLYDCIEWAAAQPWSSARVGLLGISYYAVNQWLVASLEPPHLTAMLPWEGAGDFYRDGNYHGGIRATAKNRWYRRVIESVQHGLGERGATNPNTGELVTGPETLTDDELAANRADYVADIKSHPLDDAWHRERSAHWDDITVPFLSAGNWGGHGLHLRGNVEGFVRAASPDKWLEIHGREHWTEFYTDYGTSLQRRFFDHFLKGADNGWERQPRVSLQVRSIDGFTPRGENEWPLARTRWTKLYLDAAGLALAESPPESGARTSYAATGDGVTFSTAPLAAATEITGPVAAKLFCSSDTTDADLFAVVRVFAPDGSEVTFQAAVDPHGPIAQGWLRASHRKLDARLSTPYRPYHTHDEIEPLVPGELYELDVEIWPTSIVVPAGYRVALTIRGTDYEYPGLQDGGPQLSHFRGSTMRGSGIYLHDDPDDRPPEIYGGTVTLATGGDHASYLLVPVIPAE
jgi:predicted acyl esterase